MRTPRPALKQAAGAVEILRLYYNAAALVDRLHATRNGQVRLVRMQQRH